MRAIRRGRILPPQTVADNVDDPADHPPVIDPPPAVRAGKMRADPSHLSVAQQKQIAHGGHLRQSQNHGLSSRDKSLMGPEPSLGSAWVDPSECSRLFGSKNPLTRRHWAIAQLQMSPI